MAQDKIPLYLKAKIEVSDDFKSLSDVERNVAIQLREQGYAILRGIIEEALIDQIIDDCKGKYTARKKHKNKLTWIKSIVGKFCISEILR